MISFIINVLKLVRSIVKGVRYDQEFRVLSLSIVSLLAGSTFYYWRAEGWSAIDALYFSVMTMSTVGYGDLVPTTQLSKIFTIIFTFLSIGIFVAWITKIVAVTMEQNKKTLARIKSAVATKDENRNTIEKAEDSYNESYKEGRRK